jgi:phosphonate transport system substrate-binding protein
MFKALALSLLLFLAACQTWAPTLVERVVISFSPSVIPSELEVHFPAFSAAFIAALREEGYELVQLELRVEETNQKVQDRIEAGLSDIAWMRINNYLASQDYASPLLSEAFMSYIYNDLSLYQDSNPPAHDQLVSTQRSLIYATPSPRGRGLSDKARTDQALSWIDLNAVRWCHVLVSSYEGYIYGSLWLQENYQRRLSELNNRRLVVRGYDELIERAADESCDVIIGPQSLRETYVNEWRSLRQARDPLHRVSIYEELFPIGMSAAYAGDLFVTSNQSAVLSFELSAAIGRVLMRLHREQHPLFEVFGFEGLVEADPDVYQSMHVAYRYLQQLIR